MDARWTMFVEGDSDRRFLHFLMKHIGLTNVDIEMIGGGVSHLPTVEPVVRRNHDMGNHIAVLLEGVDIINQMVDNSPDYQSTR